ncbi:MAG: hypothetical protein HDS14_00335 [Bacteroides sp.]|nr:hypothetical protein [Bacteroides sp.]
MNASLLSFLIVICVALAVAPAYTLLPLWVAGTAGGAALLLLALLYRLVILPQRIARNGFDLLASQEANNRLRPTGFKEPDRLVELFNSLMQTLHQATRSLREQEQIFSQIVSVAPMGILVLDPDMKVRTMNPAFRQLCALPQKISFEGRPLHSIKSPTVAEMDAMKPGETRLIRPDGQTLLRCRRLWFLQAGFRNPFFMIENLSEEVARAEKEAYGKVVRLISHEVNNNMAGIIPLLEYLSSLHPEEKELEEWIEAVRQRCGNMSRFINSYADVVRLPEPDLVPTDLSVFLTRLLPFLESIAGHPITLDLPSTNSDSSYPLPDPQSSLLIAADTAMLEQAIVNILTNARQAIERSPRSYYNKGDYNKGDYNKGEGENRIYNNEETPSIIISAAKTESGEITLTISNNGEPLTEEQTSRLFTPFYSSRPDGQGIGLTLTAEILRRHNCRFTLRTEPDSRTRFRIHFPVLPEPTHSETNP